MPTTPTDKRKAKVQAADRNLFRAIDRLFTIWREFYPQHPQEAKHLEDVMFDIEATRFRLAQWYKRQWGGWPGWIIQGPEIADLIRQQVAEWARGQK